jgi:hypothetical protein
VPVALADEEADAEVVDVLEAELEELLLHPAASPVAAMASRAITGALFLRKREIIFADCH